ncbi:hypothetical protein HNR62_001895 [Oceanisphaera litoralis]|uniref:hypothetical protein n=1 Tax=Oceanisphaera litoralis TaxID=225144 RepID=UPI00195C46FD|nr:hypothetical protein [Oceanisphaera litoralis]MBM7456015.1 hypothetical protein [Oceanisphaera litoralis]
MNSSHHDPAGPTRLIRSLRLALLIGIVIALNMGGSWLAGQLDLQLFPRHEALINIMVLAAVCLYIGLMALPFMPGIEIGLALMMLLGSKGALLVYLCTLVALSLSFLIGRIIPPPLIYRLLSWLHLHRACALVRKLAPLNRQQRLALLGEQVPGGIAPLLLKYRYLTIAVALNLPGNALIGGGGGIGLVVGMSRLIPFHGFLALIALAVAPVPLWFFFFGG